MHMGDSEPESVLSTEERFEPASQSQTEEEMSDMEMEQYVTEAMPKEEKMCNPKKRCKSKCTNNIAIKIDRLCCPKRMSDNRTQSHATPHCAVPSVDPAPTESTTSHFSMNASTNGSSSETSCPPPSPPLLQCDVRTPSKKCKVKKEKAVCKKVCKKVCTTVCKKKCRPVPVPEPASGYICSSSAPTPSCSCGCKSCENSLSSSPMPSSYSSKMCVCGCSSSCSGGGTKKGQEKKHTHPRMRMAYNGKRWSSHTPFPDAVCSQPGKSVVLLCRVPASRCLSCSSGLKCSSKRRGKLC